MDQFAVLDTATTPARPAHWSLDAWAMCRPDRAFRYIASQKTGRGLWLALRRPLFVAFILGCGISLMTTGVLTLRLLISVTAYWTFVPAVEALGLIAVLRKPSGNASWAATIDRFFVGHGTWTLFMTVLAASLAFLPPQTAWRLLTTMWLVVLVVVLAWSGYVDFCFFRWVTGASRASATRRLLVHRLLTWTAIFIVFAVPNLSPVALGEELREAFVEIFRR
jgi:hypothetical protein